MKAYEYAWTNMLSSELQKYKRAEIIDNPSLIANRKPWLDTPNDIQEILKLSAKSAIETLVELEPSILEQVNDSLSLEFQKDATSSIVNFRNLIIKGKDISGEIGLSLKYNHESVCHNSLSKELDFGQKWYDVPCSENYWNEIGPIFNRLSELKNKNVKWSDLTNKTQDVFVPLLNAFISEIKSASSTDNNMPKKLVEFLTGINEHSKHSKILNQDDKQLTIIRTFGIHGTSGTSIKPHKIQVSAITVPIVDLPTKLIYIDFKENSSDTVEMILNNGWELNVRIYNDSTYVEPCLNFDIEFVGTPVGCKYN